MHMFGFAFTISTRRTEEERDIIVTIDCRLRFVCGEVEVCNIKFILLFLLLLLCVSNPCFRRGDDVTFTG